MNTININIKKKSFPLKIQNKTKENIIFKNFNIDINHGQFISIFGPSGCGKTTLLNIISGLDENFDGFINIKKDDFFKKK